MPLAELAGVAAGELGLSVSAALSVLQEAAGGLGLSVGAALSVLQEATDGGDSCGVASCGELQPNFGGVSSMQGIGSSLCSTEAFRFRREVLGFTFLGFAHSTSPPCCHVEAASKQLAAASAS